MTEAELRIERQRLIRRQHAIASELNSIGPVAVPPGHSTYTQARIDGLYAESRGNTSALNAIDKELEGGQ